MKAYITCPVSHTQNRLDLLPHIKAVCEEVGIDSFIFEVGGTPEEIFQRDMDQLKSSDLLIAEVTERSHGVGIEIGLSYPLGLKRILLIEKGQFVTKLAQGIPETFIITYVDLQDMHTQLLSLLRSVSS